jgi:magnesium chelatase subunit D
MSAGEPERASSWSSAIWALQLFSVDPLGTGGICLRARPGPVRKRWLELLIEAMPGEGKPSRVPHYADDAALLGGLDLTATLRNARPVAQRGLLARADGGVVVLTSAERATSAVAARIGEALDVRQIALQREGLDEHYPARLGLVMLDEGIDDERPPSGLLDRVAFHLDLDSVKWSDVAAGGLQFDSIAAAKARLSSVKVGDDVVRALSEAAAALGIPSFRAVLFALRAACAAAALAGKDAVTEDEVVTAAALVFGPRATSIPANTEASQDREPPREHEPSDDRQNNEPDDSDHSFAEMIIEAARAAIPPRLLAELQADDRKSARAKIAGRAGAVQSSLQRGRPAGVRRGKPRGDIRLNVLETLRAAAPWQTLRRREKPAAADAAMKPQRIEIRRDDFRITHREQRSETMSIFAVDASGSSALHRLAEAKGAVEQILADCYIRRDHVALLVFRGASAELILPPTRSLARAKRSLAGIPGGGGTPLAAAIDAAFALAVAARRKGQAPVIVLLTDGRANVARKGLAGREQAKSDALEAARAVRANQIAALVVDTSPQPHVTAEQLAAEMGARYLPLPYADAKTLSQAVQSQAAATISSSRHHARTS